MSVLRAGDGVTRRYAGMRIEIGGVDITEYVQPRMRFMDRLRSDALFPGFVRHVFGEQSE